MEDKEGGTNGGKEGRTEGRKEGGEGEWWGEDGGNAQTEEEKVNYISVQLGTITKLYPMKQTTHNNSQRCIIKSRTRVICYFQATLVSKVERLCIDQNREGLAQSEPHTSASSWTGVSNCGNSLDEC